MTRVAFVGLGNMGRPMAANLAAAGHDVIGFDASSDALAGAAESGIRLARSLAEAAEDADIIITMLPNGDVVRQCYQGEAGLIQAAKAGAVLVDCSTIDVDSAREAAQAAAARGLGALDAPVSGGIGGAAGGTLTFMVGGPRELFEAVKPLLETMGKKIVHCGANGAGQAAKICNNMILGVSMIAVSEAFVLAESLGLEAQALFDVASASSGQCWALTSYCPVPGPVATSPANRDYAPGFAAALMLKDLKLAQLSADSSGAQTPMGALAARIFEAFDAQGFGQLDFSAIVKAIRAHHLPSPAVAAE